MSDKDSTTMMVLWQNEDELPKLTNTEYDLMYPLSRYIPSSTPPKKCKPDRGFGVRMFPYILKDGTRYYLREKA